MLSITPHDTPKAWQAWLKFNTEAAEQGVLPRFWLNEMEKGSFVVPVLNPPEIPSVPDMPADGDAEAMTQYREAVEQKRQVLGLYNRWRKGQRIGKARPQK